MQRILFWLSFCRVAAFVTDEKQQSKCDRKLDLVIILDSSASLSDKDFEMAKLFAKNLTRRFVLAKDRVRLSVVAYSQYIKIPFKFQDFYPEEKVLKAIDNFNHEASVTLTTKMFETVQNELLSAKYGSRPRKKDVKRALVLFTDGRSTSGLESTQMFVQPIKNLGIEIFAVGPKHNLNYQELRAMVSEPADSHIFSAETSKDYDNLIGYLVKKLC